MNRALSRTVYFLDKRLVAVPTPTENKRLHDAGRVKEILFTKQTSSSEIGVILQSSFSLLAGRDLSR